MTTIKLTVAYDGTDFSGWQAQSGARTVQTELETALARVHGHPVGVTGSGRTDSGVHARGQVAHFATDLERMPADRFVPALNSLLPKDVRVVSSERAPDGFHARFDAFSRTYRYFITPSRVQFPEERLYRWRINRRPDLGALNRAAAFLLGEHDFTTFANPNDASRTRCRYVHAASFRAEGDGLFFEITANAFLWRMVRSTVGTLIEFEAAGSPPERLRDALAARDRTLAGVTAPAHGLFLWKVDYYSAGAPEKAPDPT